MSDLFKNHIVGFPTRRLKHKQRHFFFSALLAKKGALAVKSLTSDAIIIPPTRRPTNVADNPVRQFQKKGDYSRAVQDLIAVLPERIKDFSTSTGVRYMYKPQIPLTIRGLSLEFLTNLTQTDLNETQKTVMDLILTDTI